MAGREKENSVVAASSSDPLTIAGRTFRSRLFLGSAAFPNRKIMLDALEASGTELVTVAVRRVDLEGDGEGIVEALADDYFILPNTAGCFTAREAVLTAQLAREALGTDWIKLEVIGDRETLYPDVEQLIAAAAELVGEGFTVLPYCSDDPVTCRKLADLGCAAVMPLGAPIGSGIGLRNPHNLQLVMTQVSVPVIVDAGIGTASDAALAMELGCDAVLTNSAIARARDPVRMARAMRHAVEAGRLAGAAGRMPRQFFAEATSPTLGMIRA